MALREVVLLAVFTLQILTVAASNHGQSNSFWQQFKFKRPGGGNTGGDKSRKRMMSIQQQLTTESGHPSTSSVSGQVSVSSSGQGEQVSPVKKNHLSNNSPASKVSKDGDQVLTKAGSRGSYSPNSRSTTSTGRELISSNGAENVGAYADGSKGIECKLYTIKECVVSFNGIPQEVQDLAVRQTEVAGHVDVKNKRIQLFVKKNGVAPHSFTCQNIDWREFEQYCDVKTGDIKSPIDTFPDMTSIQMWWVTIGKLFDSEEVVCDLYRENGMCKTTFDQRLSSSSRAFIRVNVSEELIRLLVKTAKVWHAYECSAGSYAMFDLACDLETLHKVRSSSGVIAKQRVTTFLP